MTLLTLSPLERRVLAYLAWREWLYGHEIVEHFPEEPREEVVSTLAHLEKIVFVTRSDELFKLTGKGLAAHLSQRNLPARQVLVHGAAS